MAIDKEFPQNGKKMMWHEVLFDFTLTSFTQTGDIRGLVQVEEGGTIHATKVAEDTRAKKELGSDDVPRFPIFFAHTHNQEPTKSVGESRGVLQHLIRPLLLVVQRPTLGQAFCERF